MIIGDRSYVDWTRIPALRERAKTFFKNGEPYDSAVSSHQNMFQQMNIIRNAIAHSSDYSREKFKRLVRDQLGTYPRGLTVAKFLGTPKPGAVPPITFIEYYLSTVDLIADAIVPN